MSGTAPSDARGRLQVAGVPDSDRMAHYRDALGAMAQVVGRIEPDGRIAEVSGGVTALLGHAPQELVGTSAFDLIHPDDQQLAAMELLDELANPRRSAEAMLIRLACADGTYRRVEVLGLNRLDDPLIGGVLLSVRDVGAARVGDRVLAASEALFGSVIAIASEALCIFDPAGRAVYASPSLATMLGCSAAELFGEMRLGRLLHPDDIAAWKRCFTVAVESPGVVVRSELRLLRRNGESLGLELTMLNLLEEERVRGIVVHGRNIEERRVAEAELRRRAAQDPLTGLANRHELMDRLAAVTESGATDCCLLFCDLDGFKAINDELGHLEGDRVLVAVADAIRSVAGPDDVVSRLGGDEFCVLATALGPQGAAQLARRVVHAVAEVTSRGRPLSVSVGVACADAATTPDRLLLSADHAMYAAKRSGGATVGGVRCLTANPHAPDASEARA